MESFLSTQKKGEACGEVDGLIYPLRRFSSMKSSVSFVRMGSMGKFLQSDGTNESSKFISWSHDLEMGNRSADFFSN